MTIPKNYYTFSEALTLFAQTFFDAEPDVLYPSEECERAFTKLFHDSAALAWIVGEIQENSPVERAGLQSGDHILSLAIEDREGIHTSS